MARRTSVTARPITIASILLCTFGLTAPTAAFAQIVINEILPNPVGTDDGTERIEIYNAGGVAVDVTGWAIDDAATFDQVAVRARLPEDFDTATGCSGSAIIQPGEYRLVKGQTAAAWVNNGGDDIYLISDRVSVPPPVVHQVTYGAAIEGKVWSCIPDGSVNFAWRDPTLCATNGGVGDGTPPSTISDLLAMPGSFPGEIVLTWTAPGDDGAVGTASEYRIKVSYAAITAGNIDAAADLERWIYEPLPAPAGTFETWTVFGMAADTTYFFAIVAIDDASNESGVSNSPSSAPQAGDLMSSNPLGYNTYYGNLHSHTSYSDGDLTPADAYSYARFTAPTPLDFMAVTEHNHSGAGMALASYALGHAEAAAANSEGNFVALFGQEWGFAVNGHVNIFESPVLFGWEAGNYDVLVAEGDYASLYSAIVANPPSLYPPVAAWNHPSSANFSNMQVTADGQSVVHLMAVVNGPAFSVATDESDVGNTNYDAVFAEALQKGYRVSPVADQDNHNITWGASTQSRTVVLARALNKSAIMNALAAGRTYASMDHNVVVEFSADHHTMGEAFATAAGVRIAVDISDPDTTDSVSQIEVFRGITGGASATRVAFNENNSTLHWRELESFTNGTEAHYYLRIRKASGNSIWTGPVYVTYDSSVLASVPTPRNDDLVLAPPYPNPSRAGVTIRFGLSDSEARVRLGIYDLSGRLVNSLVDQRMSAGMQTVTWDGSQMDGRAVQAGVYFVRMQAGAASAHRKILYVR